PRRPLRPGDRRRHGHLALGRQIGPVPRIPHAPPSPRRRHRHHEAAAMTVPFEPRPNDPDADHLNALLDAMRSGTRAPDAASMESPQAADLADAADQLRGLVRRADAPAAAYLNDHPLQNQWEDIM